MDEALVSAVVVVGYYLLGYLLAILIGQALIGPLVRVLIRRYLSGEREITPRGLARIIGAIEQILYISAILVGKPEFIGVWLVVKVAGEWRRRASEDHPFEVGQAPQYTIFLIGNGLAIIVAVGMATLMQQLLPPLPSFQQWRLPTP